MRAKQIYKYDNLGAFIEGYPSVVSASLLLGCEQSQLRNSMKKLNPDGKQPMVKGFYWSYQKKNNLFELEKVQIVKEVKNSVVKCPNCRSANIVKDGVSKNKMVSNTQRYKCKDCNKSFSVGDNNIKKRRIVVISDLHCGHVTGLTPPSFNNLDDKYMPYRKRVWDWYISSLKSLGHIDILIVNGDAIDGRQEKGSGDELLSGNRMVQRDMATVSILSVQADKVYMVRGTPYHVGKLEDWEDQIAEKCDAEIFNVLKLSVNGCKINARHKTGRSGTPHGRYTQLALQGLWEDLKIAGTDESKVNILIRSHVHYTAFMGNGSNRLALTTPALQGNSEYGEKECTGIVDFGFTYIDIDCNGIIDKWGYILSKLDDDSNKYIEG